MKVKEQIIEGQRNQIYPGGLYIDFSNRPVWQFEDGTFMIW